MVPLTLTFHLLVDGGYSGQSVAKRLPSNCELSGRCLLDALLYAPPPERRKGQNGRTRKVGARLEMPRQMLERGAGEKLTLWLYGKQARVRVVSAVALWYKVLGQRPVRVAAVSPLREGRKEEVFFSTVLKAMPA